MGKHIGVIGYKGRTTITDVLKNGMTRKIYPTWVCKECGHEHPRTKDLHELGYYATPSGVCITKCQACGSYAVARRHGLHSGEFLVVKAHNKIKGKG